MIAEPPAVTRAIAALARAGRQGDRLPAERELADRFGVGRAAVRRALAELDAAGLTITRAQVGTYIR